MMERGANLSVTTAISQTSSKSFPASPPASTALCLDVLPLNIPSNNGHEHSARDACLSVRLNLPHPRASGIGCARSRWDFCRGVLILFWRNNAHRASWDPDAIALIRKVTLWSYSSLHRVNLNLVNHSTERPLYAM